MSKKSIRMSDGERKLLKRRDEAAGEEHDSDEEQTLVSRMKEWLNVAEKKKPEPKKDEESLLDEEDAEEEDVEQDEDGGPDPEEEDKDYEGDEDDDEDDESESEGEEEESSQPTEDDKADDPLDWVEEFLGDEENEKVFRALYIEFLKHVAVQKLDFMGKNVKVAESLRNENLYQSFKDVIAQSCSPKI